MVPQPQPTLGVLLLKLLYHLWIFSLRVVGVAVGVGFGLGFALHVRDTLEKWTASTSTSAGKQTQPDEHGGSSTYTESSSTAPSFRPMGSCSSHSCSARGLSSSNKSRDSSYHSLMLDAGYIVPPTLRGQVLKQPAIVHDEPANATPIDMYKNRGSQVMKDMFPSLPTQVTQEMGPLIDLIMRDYIASWYSSVDSSVPYTDPTAIIENSNSNNTNTNPNESEEACRCTTTTTAANAHDKKKDSEYDKSSTSNSAQQHRTMLYSTNGSKPSPFMDVMYDFLAFLFGNFGVTVMDRLNVLRFVMVKVVMVLAKSLQIYRLMRERAIRRIIADQQQHSNKVIVNNIQCATTVSSDQQQQQQQAEYSPSPMLHQTFTAEKHREIAKLSTDTEPRNQKLSSATNTTSSKALTSEGGGNVDNHNRVIIPSEAAIAREFFQAGRLHTAINFGIDVRSLLCSIVDEDEIIPVGIRKDYTNDDGISACQENTTAEDIASSSSSKNCDMQETHKFNTDFEDDNRPPNKCPLCHPATKIMLDKPPSNYTDFPMGRRLRYSNDIILAHRLFHTNILYEAELDYNRVLASQMYRKLVPTRENSSLIIRSMGVEMLAGCVLTPVMSMFSPDTSTAEKILSEEADWRKCENAESTEGMIAITDDKVDEGNAFDIHCQTASVDNSEEGQANFNSSMNTAILDGSEGALLSANDLPEQTDKSNPNIQFLVSRMIDAGEELSVYPGDEDFIKAYDNINNTDFTDMKDDESAGLESSSDENQSTMDEGSLEEEEREYSKEDDADNDDDEGAALGHEQEAMGNIHHELFDNGMHLLPLTTIAVSEVVSCLEVRNSDTTVDWDTVYAKERVCDLVLITEAAILHGRRKFPKGITSDEGVFGSLTMVVMEMTADLEGLQGSISQKETELKSAEIPDVATADWKPEDIEADQAESSTLRTVIAAWLQTGNLHKMIRALTESKYILANYYWRHAFFNQSEARDQFLRPLAALDNVEVLVDTLRVLGAENQHIFERSNNSDTQGRRRDVLLSISDTEQGGSSATMLRSWSTQQTEQSAGFPITGVVKGANNAVSAAQNKFTNVRATMTANRQRITRWVTNKPVTENTEQNSLVRGNSARSGLRASNSIIRSEFRSTSQSKISVSMSGMMPLGIMSSVQLPLHLDFHPNESFASNLRTERERRLKSWQNIVQEDFSQKLKDQTNIFTAVIHGKSNGQVHRELHQLSHLFYKSTVVVRLTVSKLKQNFLPSQTSCDNVAEGDVQNAITDVIAKRDSEQSNECTVECSHSENCLQLTLSVVSSRRKIEVPDEDSSFLIRGQPRELTPVSAKRDQQNLARSFKCYAASYDVTINSDPNEKVYRGGRYIRPCLLYYFPTDRTALIQLQSPEDQADLSSEEDLLLSTTSTIEGASKKPEFPNLPPRLLSERTLLSKTSKGGTIVNNAVDPADFACVPRPGKALDFIYRVSLFEKPIFDLAGKRLTMYDNTFFGPHKADASARELSDASLTYAIIMGGSLELSLGSGSCVMQSTLKKSLSRNDGIYKESELQNSPSCDDLNTKKYSETDVTPYVALKMKVAPKGREPYEKIKYLRPSFVRAALLVASSKKEAQLQCLVTCVKAGSARNATKARAEALLRPAMCLLEYAISSDRKKEQALLRDVGMGITHIDKDQLRRNGMIEPRFPSTLRRLKVRVEDVEYPAASITNAKPSPIYKFRCYALTEVISEEDNDSQNIHAVVRSSRTYYREEWVIRRSFKDIVTLHKHLKTQVGETAPRFGLPGAGHKRGNVALVPTLQQSAKNVALTKRSLHRRIGVLNSYFEELLSPHNLLSGCPEILRFLAADVALPTQDSVPGKESLETEDALGRSEIKRISLKTESHNEQDSIEKSILPQKGEDAETAAGTVETPKRDNSKSKSLHADNQVSMTPEAKDSFISYVKAHVDEVKLSDVRNSVFFLLRSAFDLDNATFWRSRVFSAIRAMSYVVIGEKDFNRLLIKLHLDFLSGEKMGLLVKFLRDCIWPNGVFYTPSPESTDEEKEKQRDLAKELLKHSLPVQLKQILGEELNEEGVAMFHEMLQNRVVVKSLGYTILDLLWLELFPSLSDILTGTKALDFVE